jgi:hypothetical protein
MAAAVELSLVETWMALGASPIHTAVTLTALYAALELEYRVAVVQSSRLAFNAFQRLGLQECCDVAQYVWTP